MANLERRHLAIEVRADIQARTLVGYAARFGVEADIGGSFFETIKPGAFRTSLAGSDDIAALADHDPARLLGRRSSGTLTLNEDQIGLAFTIALPDTTVGRDMLVLAERRDLSGMSFGFQPIEDHWADRSHRELRSVRLIEVSVISGGQPAYPQTSVAARHRQGIRMTRTPSRPLTYARRRRYLAGL